MTPSKYDMIKKAKLGNLHCQGCGRRFTAVQLTLYPEFVPLFPLNHKRVERKWLCRKCLKKAKTKKGETGK